MVAAATLLRDILEVNWQLSGDLSKVPTGSGATLMDEVVQFFDRKQVIGNEVAKSITVEKINALGAETIIEHPNFREISDNYEIILYYRLVDVEEPNFSTALNNMEELAREVNSIIKNNFVDVTFVVGNNGYFRSSNTWINEDLYTGNQPELRRRLKFQITTIHSTNVTSYNGFSGVLVFDRTDSKGDVVPATDYTYLGVLGIKILEGFEQIPLLTKDVTNGIHVPFQTSGLFSGTFTAHLTSPRLDILGTGIDKIQNMYKIQNNASLKRQNATVVLLHTVENNEPIKNKLLEVNVTNAGAGYDTAPAVVFTGGGFDAPTASAKIEDGRVTGIVVLTTGSDITGIPTITLTGGTPSTIATAVAKMTGDTFESFTTKTFMKINNIFKDSMDEEMVKYTFTGTLIKPSEYSEVVT